MKRAVGRGIACVLVLSAVTACGSDDSGGGAAGGTGGATGGTGGGGTGGATGGTGGTGTGGVSGAGTGGSAGGVPCTLTLSGAKTGTVDCTNNASSEFIGVTTADTVSWIVGGDTADAKTTFTFQLAKPVTATTYEGTAGDQFCTASVTNSDFTGTWSVNSKSPAAGANCSITIDSVVEDSSGTTSRFVVHGTATATLLKGTDPATVTMDVTF